MKNSIVKENCGNIVMEFISMNYIVFNDSNDSNDYNNFFVNLLSGLIDFAIFFVYFGFYIVFLNDGCLFVYFLLEGYNNVYFHIY
jgi:hypothetical protein